MGAAHWVYLSGIVLIIAVMIARKNVVIPAIAATFLTAWTYTGSFVKGLESIFNASLTSASELFNIFLIIALVTALLGALRALGADRRMVEPFRLVMRSGHSAYWVLAFVTYAISLFFWPTPAVPLMGAILLPAAIAAGLPPIAAALAIAVAGQGMALSSDYVIQVAPGLSAKADGLGGLDAALDRVATGTGDLLLDIRTAKAAPRVAAWLARPRSIRANFTTEQVITPRRSFDAVIHLDRLTGAQAAAPADGKGS